MATTHSFEVIKTTSHLLVFRHENIRRLILATFLPAYLFEKGTFTLWRDGQMVNSCTCIEVLGPGKFVAFNSLADFTLAGRGSENLRICWCLYPWEFLAGDRLVFSLRRKLRLTEEMVRLQLYLEDSAGTYLMGKSPPEQYYLDEYREKIRVRAVQKVVLLRRPSTSR